MWQDTSNANVTQVDAGALELLRDASQVLVLRLRNVGTAQVSAPVLALDAGAGLSVTMNTCDNPLAPSFSCTVQVTLASSVAGVFTGQLTAQATAGASTSVRADVALSGRADHALLPFSVRVDGGPGGGTVRASVMEPGGGALSPFDCPTQCDRTVRRGSVVAMAATPGANVNYPSWSACAAGAACSVTVGDDAGLVVTAAFAPQGRLRVRFNSEDGGATNGASVASSLGWTCGAQCDNPVADRQSVTLTPTRTPFAQFRRWCDRQVGPCGDPCTTHPGGDACQLTMGATDRTVVAEYGFVNLAFVSPVSVPLSLGGRDAYAALCSAWAEDAGLPPSRYVALLADATGALPALAGLQGWARADGLPVTNQPPSASSYEQAYPLTLDPRGVAVPLDTPVMTGVGATNPCANWTDAGFSNAGLVGAAPPAWLREALSGQSCASLSRIYCFEARFDGGVAVRAPVPDGGRIAFTTEGRYVITGGIDAADALCAGEAADAGFGARGFRALLASNGASPWLRLNATGGAYFRTDGVQVIARVADLDGGALLAPVSRSARGTPLDVNDGGTTVWTGVGSTQPECGGWQAPMVLGTRGNAALSSSRWIRDMNQTTLCTEQGKLYCFEQ